MSQAAGQGTEPAAPVIRSSGDAALIIEFGDVIDRGMSRRVLAVSRAFRAAEIAGILDIVPTFRSLMICYDPAQTSRVELEERLRPLLDCDDESADHRNLWRIPACYDGEFGPDLDDVARTAGMKPHEVIEAHSALHFHVYMIGFLPGYPYMGDLPAHLRLPRRQEPRTRVPARSVAIAQQLTGIYPVEAPGGWHLIARTPALLFDVSWPRPSLIGAGDMVRFEPISAAEYRTIEADVASGRYRVPAENMAAT